MKINTTYSNKAIRFCRFSRKKYAAFCSVGRCVTIGELRNYIADLSLIKGDDRCHTSQIDNLSVATKEKESEQETNNTLILNELISTNNQSLGDAAAVRPVIYQYTYIGEETHLSFLRFFYSQLYAIICLKNLKMRF